MTIIGISPTHDGTLTVIRDGKNVFSIGEERLNRIKAYIGFPFKAVRYIVEENIISPDEVDEIAISLESFTLSHKRTYAFVFTENKKYYDIQSEKKPSDFFIDDEEYLSVKTEQELKAYVTKKVKNIFSEVGIDAPVSFVNHHLCHAASTYYSSGFESALAITMDGIGDWISATVYDCEKGQMDKLSETDHLGSVGFLYSAVTKKCGFIGGRHEGKITGLAAYGDYKKHEKCFDNLTEISDGKLRYVNPKDGLSFMGKVERKLKSYVGVKALQGQDKLIRRCGELSKEDLAASIQHHLEKRIVEIVKYWLQETGKKTIVLAGGVFANVKFNQHISEIAEVESLYIYPDMGDGGNAYGAAIYRHFQKNSYNSQISKIKNVYYGPEFDNEYIQRVLESVSDKVEFKKSANIAKDTAKAIANNNIVGWFQGRMEYGPRALGNRSILASPVDRTINKWLNERMKRTEFMPFAPSCLYEYADDVFEIQKESLKYPAQFMTITFKMKEKWAKKAPAVSHIDQTARPQLVTKEVNSKYHELLSEYYRLTGLPMCINTSFNVHEEPIVCKPQEGLDSLLSGVIDVFACGDYLATMRD
jgi:carbamoyltransferase